MKKYEEQETDSKSFHFNLQSKNNRLPQPMKFENMDPSDCGIKLFEKSVKALITLGDIVLGKENQISISLDCKESERFNYHIDFALRGKAGFNEESSFKASRILVIQMK